MLSSNSSRTPSSSARQLAHEACRNYVTGIERRKKRPVFSHHFSDGLAKREDRGFKPFQQLGAEQADQGSRSCTFILIFTRAQIGVGRVARERDAVIVVRVERCFKPVEVARQQSVQTVAHRDRPRLREYNGHQASVRTCDTVAGVVLLDELAGSFNRRRIDDRIQHVRTETCRIFPHRLLEALANGKDPLIREVRVLAHEKTHQMIKVPQGIVDRGRGQQ